MITSYYRSPDGRLASTLSDDAMRDALASSQGMLWVDLEAASREEASLLSSVFDFHHLAIDDCFNRHIELPDLVALARAEKDGGLSCVSHDSSFLYRPWLPPTDALCILRRPLRYVKRRTHASPSALARRRGLSKPKTSGRSPRSGAY